MNQRFAFVALFVVSILPAQSQLKPIVATRTVATTFKFEDLRNFALPTFCDDKQRAYVKLWQARMGTLGPVYRISHQGAVEATFDTSNMLGNIFAVRPDGGISTVDLNISSIIDNFNPDGTRLSEVQLERPPVPFFPAQLAVFPSGAYFAAGPDYRANESQAAVYDSQGHLVRQFVPEREAAQSSLSPASSKIALDPPRTHKQTLSRSVAITGHDGNVYLLRATAPPTVYVISSEGAVLRHFIVQNPAGVAWPGFGIRVVSNKLMVQFHRECSNLSDINSCKGTAFSVLDASTGQPLVNYALADGAPDVVACYAPGPDRFSLLQDDSPHGTEIKMVEMTAQ